MIRGYFHSSGTARRPFVDAVFTFPGIARALEVPLLVDTGADHTVLAPFDALRLQRRLGIVIDALAAGRPSMGVGGQMDTKTISAVLTLDAFSTPVTLTILDPRPPRLAIPSLLGRDIVSRFALYVEQAEDLVMLLDPEEARNLRPHFPETRTSN